jgi:phosphohistidine phosphatase
MAKALILKTMLVCIMRHGEAEATPDSSGERHLTQRGASQVAGVLNLAKQMGVTVNAIATSPLARAKDTAEIAKKVFGLDYAVTNALEPEGSPEEVYEELSKHKLGDSVLLISHQPLISKLLSDILGAETRVEFSTGTMAVVRGSVASGGGVLVLLIPPRAQIS